MPRIKEYEADVRITPSMRGYEAAMISGRRIAQLMREGNQDLRKGVESIGHAFDQGEVKAQRRAAKAEARAEKEAREEERYSAKMDANEEKRQRQADAQAKKDDVTKGRTELTQGIYERAALKSQFTNERAQMERTIPPAQLPAALDKWMNDRVRPAYEQFRQKFSSESGGQTAEKLIGQDLASIRFHTTASSSAAAGHAVADQLHGMANLQIQRVMEHPEQLNDARQEFHSSFNALVAHTAPGLAAGNIGPAGEIASALKARGFSDAAVQGALANVKGESDFSMAKKGDAGEEGYFQFHPKTHLPLYNKQAEAPGVEHWSATSQANYVADVIEKEMPDYKNMTDPAAATRKFMTGFERPKDQSEEAQQKRINNLPEVAGLSGAAPATRASVQRELEKTNSEAMRKLTLGAIHGAASKDPNVARQMLNDPANRQYLKPEDLDPIGKQSIESSLRNYEKLKNDRDLHSEASQRTASRVLSGSKAVDYVNQLHDDKGHSVVPDGWVNAVAHDPDLREEDRQSLIAAQHRMAEKYKGSFLQQNAPSWMPGAGMPTEEPSKVGDDRSKGTVQALVDQMSNKDKPFSPNMIIDHVGVDLNTHDAAFLLGFTDPRLPIDAAHNQLNAFKRTIDEAHSTLAPRNPDGSRNEAGETAYRKFLGDFIPQYRQAQAGGSGISALDPNSPEYLLKNNKVQKYAVSPDKAASRLPEVPTSARPDLGSLFKWDKPADELAREEPTAVPEINGTGLPVDPDKLAAGEIEEAP